MNIQMHCVPLILYTPVRFFFIYIFFYYSILHEYSTDPLTANQVV